MLHRAFLYLGLTTLVPQLAPAHGVPTPTASGPLHVQQSLMVDATGQFIQLRGVEMPGLNIASPNPDQRATVAALYPATFGILRLRWNLNGVRLPVSNTVWRRDGPSYLDRVGAIVQAANDAGLIVVLSNYEDAGLPTADTVAFWKTWAAHFKDRPHVIFGVFNQPSIRLVPGHSATQRQSSDWQFWLGGGTASNGQPVVGMQALVDAIRSAGAAQVIAVSAFFDALDFQGFGPDFYVKDPNIIYEVDPFYDHALTNEDRERNFGFLARSVPVYAGRWGLDLNEDTAACRSVPPNPQGAVDLLFQTFAYFDSRFISWTTSSFEPRSLVQNVGTFEPTTLDHTWHCGTVTDPQPGMAQVQLLWLTGDPTGFGVLAADQVASAAGGPSAPVSPGEVINFFGFLFGPQSNAAAFLDASAKLPTALDGVRIFFDGEAAPIFSAGAFEITAQVYVTGYGQTSPPGVTGQAAQAPYAQPVLSPSLLIDGAPAEILYAAEAPGYVGLLQVNARVPATLSTGTGHGVPVVMMIGSRPSLPGITLWVE